MVDYYPLQNRGDIKWRNSAAVWLQNAYAIGGIGQEELCHMIDRESFPFADSTMLKMHISGH
jgi:hypothetical protein